MSGPVCHEDVGFGNRCRRRVVYFWMARPRHGLEGDGDGPEVPICACDRHNPNFHFWRWDLRDVSEEEFLVALVLCS